MPVTTKTPLDERKYMNADAYNKAEAEQQYYNNLYSQMGSPSTYAAKAKGNTSSTATGALSTQTKLNTTTPVTYEGSTAVGKTLTPASQQKKAVGKTLTPASEQNDNTVVEETPIKTAAPAVDTTPTIVQATQATAPIQTAATQPTYTYTAEKPTYSSSAVKPTYDYTSEREAYEPTTYEASVFEPSQEYYQAWEETKRMLAELKEGRTSYTDSINNKLAEIENKPKFEYDFNTDPLFQSMLSSYTRKGQAAMQDTMGQAAALTGGYGSSYSQVAGNQAYNQYIQAAFDNLPEYYQTAFNTYQAELQNAYNLLAEYRASDEAEYSRKANAYEKQNQLASDILNRDYTKASFDESNRQWADQMNQSEKRYAAEQQRLDEETAYGKFRDQMSDYYKDVSMDYEQYRDAMADYFTEMGYDYQATRDAISDSRYADETAYEREQNAIANALKEYSTKQGVALDWANYNLKKQAQQDANDQWQKEYDLSKEKQEAKSETKYTDPSETQMNKALEAYASGGWDAVDDYVAKLPDNIDVSKLYKVIQQQGSLNYSLRDYDLTNDTFNWMGGLNNNNLITDPSTGKVYTLAEMAKLIAEQEGITLDEAKKKLYKYN